MCREVFQCAIHTTLSNIACKDQTSFDFLLTITTSQQGPVSAPATRTFIAAHWIIASFKPVLLTASTNSVLGFRISSPAIKTNLYYEQIMSDDDDRSAFLMYLQGLLPVKRAGVESEFPGAPTSLLAWIREVPFASFDGEKVHLSIGDMVTLGERSLEILPMEHPLRGPCLYYLGQSLFARFKSIGDITDLHTCIGRVREALGCSLGPHHPLYWSCRLLVEGVLCLLDTNDQSIPQSPAETMQTVTAQRSSQEEAHKIAPSASKVDIWRKVVDHTPSDSPERPLFLLFLVTSLRLRFGETFDTRDIDEVIDRAREAVDIIPRDSPDRPMYLMEVGISFSSRFDGFGEIKDIDEAIAIEREVAEVTPRDDPDCPTCLNNLGELFRRRFERFGDTKDINKAIETFCEAIELTPRDSPDLPIRLNNLGISCSSRFYQFGDALDIDIAIAIELAVVKFIPRDSPDRPACLSNLSEAFRRRFERFGDKNDLKEGISSLCDAVGSTPHNSPDYPGRLNNLGILYSSRFERFGDITDINEAISCESDAVEATPSDSPDRPVFLSNLGEARRRRFKRLGHENDIKEGITSLCDAVKVTPHDSPDYPGRLNNLAILYSSRFERFGDISDIDEAISNVRGALEVLPHDSPARPVCLSNLGEALHRRFVRFGDAKDINTAIVCLREAVELTPQDNPGYPSRINNLGILFSSRFERFGDVNDIAEAISRGSIAIEFTPHDSPDRPSRLNSRGASFWYRFKQFGDKSDIDTAIASMLEAVNGTPDNSPDLPSHLNNLGFLYSKRFGLLAVVKDIDDAIEMQRKAVELTPPDSPTISAHLNNLGDSLLLRNSTTQDFKEAMSVYSLSSKSSNGYPSDRFLASSKLANRLYAADDCSAAYEGYVLAISVLPQIAWIGLDVVSQLEQLSSFISTLPCDAAACAFKLAEQEPHLTQEHLEHAIQFLDHGRSILLTQAANFRSDMKELKNQAPKLAEELEIVGRALIQGSFRDLRENIVSEEAHRRSVKKFEQLLCDARQLHGFEDFLRPPPIAKLRLTAAHGPVIIINISTYRCDALIIRPHADETVHMPLSAANMTEVNKLAGELAEAVAAFENGDELYVDPVVLKRALNKIWTCLGWPIIVKLEALGELHLGSLRRVWWCVTGMLTFLPIHASFPQLNPRKRSPAPGMMDRVISSYTPTLSALYRAQRQQPLPVLMLAVCDPSLPSAEFEMDVIGRHLSSHEVVFLKGPEMTSVRVLDLLKECTWAHFACHGIQDKDQPMNSALSMHDRNLTLSRIAQDSLCHAECAFLSACQSAQVSSRVADESLHLAAGLQSAGFRSVVGTMWSIKDMNGSIVADKFYDQVFRNGADHAAASDTALALHLALRHLRDISQVPLAQWVPFIHLGV